MIQVLDGERLPDRRCRCGSSKLVVRTARPTNAVHGMADRGYDKPLSDGGPWAQCATCGRWYEVQ